MILLESHQILAAVRRSLESHVLPAVEDDFARVQVASALKALAEIEHRLQNGDLCERLNQNIADGARDIAAGIRAESPSFANAVDAALGDAPAEEGARARNRQLVSALWQIMKDEQGPGAERLWILLQETAQQSMGEDAMWMCPEAIQSLT
jgi:hypothetical protein